MTHNCPLKHVSRLVSEKPFNELQTEVLVTKEGDKALPSDLGIRYARVLQQALPQLKEGIVINHDDALFLRPNERSRLRGRRRSSEMVPERLPQGITTEI